MKSNAKKFPENVYPKEQIECMGNEYDVYGFRFRGTSDLYNYLISEPNINYEIFGANKYDSDDIASITGSRSFAGIPYEEAVEKLVEYNDPGYQEFLSIGKQIEGKKRGTAANYALVKSVAGGRIDPVAYTTGSPFIYNSSRKIKIPKYVNINVSLGYNCGHNKSQVYNRAIIITNIVNALEQQGIKVNINAFDISRYNYYDKNEIINIIFEIKRANKTVSYQSLYRALCNVEFVRRLMFRVMETSDVKLNWKNGYGRPCERDISTKILNLKEKDLFFDQPQEMGIKGNSIENDFESVIEYLDLEDRINVEKEKVKIKRGMDNYRKN